MKVYCVMENNFPWEGCEWDDLHKIFLDKEKAEKYIESLDWSSAYWIDERETED